MIIATCGWCQKNSELKKVIKIVNKTIALDLLKKKVVSLLPSPKKKQGKIFILGVLLILHI